MDKIKKYAWYFPNFHPTPMNDIRHGKGWTEWCCVEFARPRFEGHNEDSDVSCLFITNGYGVTETFPVAAEEIQSGEKRRILSDRFPPRLMRYYSVPLYVGRRKN